MILRSCLLLVGLVAVQADRQVMSLMTSSSRRLPAFIAPISTDSSTSTTVITVSTGQHPHYCGCPSSSSPSSSPHTPRRGHLSQRRMAFDPSTVVTAVTESALTTANPLPEDAVTQEQILVGFVAGVFPFVWAAYEFWKRIDTQQRCGVCQGSGLVMENRLGRALKYPQKCYACGGFLPWQGWRRFWLSNLDIGNGGILQRPAPDYEQLSAEGKRRRDKGPGHFNE